MLVHFLPEVIINGMDRINLVRRICQYRIRAAASFQRMANSQTIIRRYRFRDDQVALEVPLIAGSKQIMIHIEIEDPFFRVRCRCRTNGEERLRIITYSFACHGLDSQLTADGGVGGNVWYYDDP